jgi:MFS transporter, DHA2 family, methylenomycin A resistance protein
MDGIPFPRHLGAALNLRWITLSALCMAVLVAQVDTAVVNLAVRPIGEYFSAGVNALQWVVDGYNLVYAVLLLTGGQLADLYGRRRIFIGGAAIFTLASLLCALAPSIAVLIAGRALAGFGAALLVPASLAILRVVWTDERERGRALGVWAACNGLAMAIGPTLGGLLIKQWGWRSIFFVVLPLSVLAIVLALASIPESSDPKDRHFDARAQLFGIIALGGLSFAAIEARATPFLALAALIAAVLGFALFIREEAGKGSSALIPLDLFAAPQFRGAVIATVGMTFGMYGALFLVPLTWQSSGALGAVGAGLALMPMALTFVVVSPFSGALVEKLGVRATTSGGVGIIGAGLLTIGLTAAESTISGGEIGLALTGLGMGMATGPLMGAAVGAVAAARSGTASSLINVARMAGATIGVAALGALYGLVGGGGEGLRAAMLAGGAVQLSCAAIAWSMAGAAKARG